MSAVSDAPTPLEEAPAGLDGGRPLFLKREDVHELGAFKWRGALPALEVFRQRGADAVVTASTGNHGAASAWAAERTGMRAIVFAPEGASQAKLELLERLGAEVHLVGKDLDAAKDLGRGWASERGLPFFEDGAEPAQFDGYAAIGRELLDQLGVAPARVVVPVGNGALLIGVARAVGDGTVGVVAKAAPVMALSVAEGRPVPCDDSDTFADGMAVRVAVPLAVTELAGLGVPMLKVSERALARAVGAYAQAGIRVEGSGAASLAAHLALGPADGPTVLIVTGRNIDVGVHQRAVDEPEGFPD